MYRKTVDMIRSEQYNNKQNWIHPPPPTTTTFINHRRQWQFFYTAKYSKQRLSTQTAYIEPTTTGRFAKSFEKESSRWSSSSVCGGREYYCGICNKHQAKEVTLLPPSFPSTVWPTGKLVMDGNKLSRILWIFVKFTLWYGSFQVPTEQVHWTLIFSLSPLQCFRILLEESALYDIEQCTQVS